MDEANSCRFTKNQAQCRVCDDYGYRVRAEAVCFKDHSRKEILLVKCRKTEKWKFPGGGVEPDETIEESAVRELREEGGISGNVIKRIGLFERREKKVKTHIYLMVANEVGGVLEDWPEKEWRLTQWYSTIDVISLLRKDNSLISLENLVDELKVQGGSDYLKLGFNPVISLSSER